MNLKYQLEEGIYDAKSMLDEHNFYNQRQGEPSQLTRTLTYILGDNNKNYPISMMTMGNIASKSTVKELDDVQFTYPVMGRDEKVSVISETLSQGTKPGVGHSQFKIRFTDNWAKRFYFIESPRGVQAYIIDHPVPLADGSYEYTVQLDGVSEEAWCPSTELQAGALWCELHTGVPESESKGTESKMAMPGKYKNQMGFCRAGMSWAGNSANKTMKISIQTDKGETTSWMDFFMWQFEKRYLNENEHISWYSRYNRTAEGNIPLKDFATGKVIPRGSGLLDQILHKSTYTRLTYNTLANRIGDALFGQSDTDNMVISLHTGKGGMREIDRAMKDEGVKVVSSFSDIADKFVSGSGGSMHDLMLGGFFTGFYHIDGYTIKVRHNPIFDMGRVANKSPRHPESGLPLESYRMVFIDDADHDGKPNIQHVVQKDRAFLHGVVPGLTPMPRSLKIFGGFNLDNDTVQVLSHEEDKSSYHRFKSGGTQVMRNNRCFDFQNALGL